MKSKEKPPIEQNEKIVDPIQDYINKGIEGSKDNITPSSLRMVDRKLLTPEVEELFWMFNSGDFATAGPKLEAVLEEIGKIKDEDKKDSNLKFVESFDQKINPDLETTKEFNDQDNT